MREQALDGTTRQLKTSGGIREAESTEAENEASMTSSEARISRAMAAKDFALANLFDALADFVGTAATALETEYSKRKEK